MRLVHVLLFGPLRESVGASSVPVKLPPHSCVRDLLRALTAAYPLAATEAVLARCIVAVNDDFAELDTELPSEGTPAVIAVIPPVSGG